MSMSARVFLHQVRHVLPDLRDPRTSALRGQIVREFGALVPPYALHLPVPEALDACWMILREPGRGSRVDRRTKEAVAAAVSATNACPYCVDVHTGMLHALGERGPADALAAGKPDAISDPELRAVVAWAGATRQPGAAVLRHPPFPGDHAPELIGVAVGFHYINRMVNIFVADSPFFAGSPAANRVVRRIASPFLRGMLTRQARANTSASPPSAASLPDDLAWARSDPAIAGAFGRAAETFETLGRRALPAGVRQLVSTRLEAWRGEDPGLSRSWVDEDLQTLPPTQRPAARLALLTAFASYQVDAGVLGEVPVEPGSTRDETLVSITAWASFATARRIGAWLLPATAVPAGGMSEAQK